MVVGCVFVYLISTILVNFAISCFKYLKRITKIDNIIFLKRLSRGSFISIIRSSIVFIVSL